MKLYMAVTNDKYEHCLALADTVAELSRMTGKRRCVIWTHMKQVEEGTRHPKGKYIFRKVEVDDIDYEEGIKHGKKR